MDAWEQYLFQGHSRGELRAWAQRLRYFRFCRAYGGHANDGDRLLVAVRHEGEADARRTCALIAGAPWTGFGHTRIERIPVFVWMSAGEVTLSLSGADGDMYQVTEADVANAAALEARVAVIADRLIDPPIGSKHCIAPAMHAELWLKT